jgi:hypothetical protein
MLDGRLSTVMHRRFRGCSFAELARRPRAIEAVSAVRAKIRRRAGFTEEELAWLEGG